MDVTPLVPSGRQVIESYGAYGFKIGGAVHDGSVLVFPDRTLAWAVTDIDDLTFESLAPVAAPEAGVEILLLGCGPRLTLVPGALRDQLRQAGVVVDPMDTGAACRTFNVLLAEERRVAAALVAVE